MSQRADYFTNKVFVNFVYIEQVQVTQNHSNLLSAKLFKFGSGKQNEMKNKKKFVNDFLFDIILSRILSK